MGLGSGSGSRSVVRVRVGGWVSVEVALDLCRKMTLCGGEVDIERVGRLKQRLTEAHEFLLALRRSAERLFEVVRQREPG